MKRCNKCNITKDIKEFYSRRTRKGHSAYCKICMGKQALLRQRDFKQKCVLYKGGQCEICGYNKHYQVLDFHHRDKRTKVFNIGELRFTSFEKHKNMIIKELDKCDLLCSNCHKEQHLQY